MNNIDFFFEKLSLYGSEEMACKEIFYSEIRWVAAGRTPVWRKSGFVCHVKQVLRATKPRNQYGDFSLQHDTVQNDADRYIHPIALYIHVGWHN